MTAPVRPESPYWGQLFGEEVFDGEQWVGLGTVNTEVGLTVRQILDSPPCSCGHVFADHFPDGLLGPDGNCEWLWGDRSCFCRTYRGYVEDPDEPADIPDWWEA